MHLLFVLLVLNGFLFRFVSTFSVSPYSARIAWGCWLVAAIMWALSGLGSVG